MQQNMPPMDGMKMEMHDTLWRNDQVTVVFRSDIPLISDGKHNTEPLLRSLNLPSQLQRLNQFLEENHVPASLTFLGDDEKPAPPEQPALSTANDGDSSKLPPGVHHFGLTAPIPTDFGVINTSVISFLKIGPARGAGGTPSERALPGHGHGSKNDESLIRTIVTTLNDGLGHLNTKSMVPIAFSAPAWLCGGTSVGQGCPLTPPMPVEVKDACSNWHIRLPDLDSRLRSKKGDGVTVFILDAFPERGVISRAARDAGHDNRLLSKVNDIETVSFDYNLMSGVQEILDMASTGNAAVGKDVYGEHYPIRMPDHGLFIAGIVRDVAPKAKIECIRVLNDLCVGDLHKLVRALWRIYKRMLAVNPDTGQAGDLYQKPVVINLSLVIPTDEEAWQKHINPVVRGFNIIQAPLHSAITSLTQVGAIVVASAGNEGDLREMGPGAKRPMALYPAAFGESIDNVIAVGAVTSTDTAASYSCYPGSRGIATYGGEVPDVQPLDPPSSDPVVTIKDALRGIYSSVEYPPLSAASADPPEQYYAAPNDHAWAYWIGTSFATPIVSAVAARILELKATGALTGSVHDAIMNTASGVVTWDNLDPRIGVPGGTTTGRMLKAIQEGKIEDRRYANVCFVSHEYHTIVPKTANLEANKEYDLRLDIGLLSPDSAVVNPDPLHVEYLPETEEGHWLEVIVVSDDFTISRLRYNSFLPNSGASWVCDCPPGGDHTCSKDSRNPYLFIPVNTPERAGIARLRIAIYYEKNLIQSQLLTAQISGAGQKAVGYTSRIDYTLTADLRDVSFLPPRTLHILTNQNVDGTHRIIINGKLENFLAFNLTEGQMGDTVRATREALRNVHFKEHPSAWGSNLPPQRDNLLDENNAKSKEKFIEDLKRLAPLGRDLWDMLLKDEKEWWKTLQEPATIQVSRMRGNTFVFPWALVYDIPLATYGEYKICPLVENWDGVHPLTDPSTRRCPHESEHGKKNTLCPFGFWGIKHIIEQPPSAKDRELPLAIQVTNEPPELIAGLSLALDKDLTTKHLQSLELTPFHVLKCPSLDEIVTALKGSVEVVYFYCHGGRTQLPGTKQETPFLEVGVNERFQPSDITVWRRAEWPEKHWEDTTPLVFLNGCHTAELTPELLVNFVDGFTAAHAAGVIGTEITLLQSFVSEAALQFFTHFQKNGMNVGQSLREMSLHFLIKGNLLGLAYTPYCSADLHL